MLPLLFRPDSEGLTLFSKLSDGIRLLKVKWEYASDNKMFDSFSELEGIDVVIITFDAGIFEAQSEPTVYNKLNILHGLL